MPERASAAAAFGTNVRFNRWQSEVADVHPPDQAEGGALMEPVEIILNEYRNADAECRMDLFLAHRDVRDRFTAIEAGEEAGRASPSSPLPLKASGASA